MKEYVTLVLRNITQRRLRSWLTILGVVIGVAAIVALITVSRSLENSVEEQFEVFGTNLITVYAKGGIPGTSLGLTEKDVDAVKDVRELELVAGSLAKSGRVSYRDEVKNVFFYSWPAKDAPRLFKFTGIEFEQGASFSSDSNVVVLGSRAAHDLFGRDVPLRAKLEANDVKVEVVGIMEPLGNPSDDGAVYMPTGTMREIFNEPDAISFIMGRVKEGVDVNVAAEKTSERLKRIRSEESFTVATAEQFLEQLGAVLGILQAVLVGIATISLVVGSIGIASAMYTSVLERTREIGIMKAVGATNSTITLLFLLESGFIGIIGGLIGITLGILIAMAVSFGAAQAGFSILKISVEPWILAFGMGFAFIVGTASGFFPARRAAKMNLVDALRK